MRRRVAVAADDCRARKREALLRADDVDDTLARIVHGEQLDAEFRAVRGQSLDLDSGILLRDELAAVRRGHIMVGDGQSRIRAAHLASGKAQALEGQLGRAWCRERVCQNVWISVVAGE